MWQDPIVKETRELREEYAEKFNHDPDAIFEDILKRQSWFPCHRESPCLNPKQPNTHATKRCYLSSDGLPAVSAQRHRKCKR